MLQYFLSSNQAIDKDAVHKASSFNQMCRSLFKSDLFSENYVSPNLDSKDGISLYRRTIFRWQARKFGMDDYQWSS